MRASRWTAPRASSSAKRARRSARRRAASRCDRAARRRSASAVSQSVSCHMPFSRTIGFSSAIFAVDALVAEAIAIGDPGLVHVLVRPRHDAHHAAAQHVRIDVGADAVVRRHQRMLRHLPRTRAIAIRLVVQRADRAQVDDVRRQLVIDALLDERADLGHLAAADRAELLEALDLLREAHAARAVNAARHVGGHERTEVLVLHHALALVVARDVAAEAHREILQLALAALVADRAVERMIDQQELHHRASARRWPSATS